MSCENRPTNYYMFMIYSHFDKHCLAEGAKQSPLVMI